MYKHMDIEEQVYEGVTPPQTHIRADANRVSHVRKPKVG